MGFLENIRLASRFQLPTYYEEEPSAGTRGVRLNPPQMGGLGMTPQASQMQAPQLPVRQPMNNFYPHGMDVVFQPPIDETVEGQELGIRRAQLGLQKEDLGLRREDLKFRRNLGEEKVGLDREKLELNQLKNQQIYQVKLDDMERKTTDAQARLALATQQLQGRENNAAAQLQFRQAQLDATNARHALDIAVREAQLAETGKVNEARIKQIMDTIENSGYQMEETELDETGRKRTVITRRGQPPTISSSNTDRRLPNESGVTDSRLADTVPMIGKDGKTYYIAKSNVEQAKVDGLRAK